MGSPTKLAGSALCTPVYGMGKPKRSSVLGDRHVMLYMSLGKKKSTLELYAKRSALSKARPLYM